MYIEITVETFVASGRYGAPNKYWKPYDFQNKYFYCWRKADMWQQDLKYKPVWVLLVSGFTETIRVKARNQWRTACHLRKPTSMSQYSSAEPHMRIWRDFQGKVVDRSQDPNISKLEMGWEKDI